MPPADGRAPWTTWLFLGGRGAGKTRAGAEWVRGLVGAASEPLRIALVGETYGDARRIMVDGVSELLATAPPRRRPRYIEARRELVWPEGSIAQLFSAEDPEGLRGPQFHYAWADELAKWWRPDETFSTLQLALRLGERPRQLITTTPRPLPLLKNIMTDARTVMTHATTAANRHNLATSFMGEMMRRYEGTSLARQELLGEIVEETEGALFSRADIDKARVREAPTLERILVGLDPPVTSGPQADECGIVIAGRDAAGDVFVLGDWSLQGRSPTAWARRVIEAVRHFAADGVVAETNQGGQLIETVLHQLEPTLRVESVRASRGKAARAEPIAALYEQGRIHHVGSLAALEDQLTSFTGAGTAQADDRLDALVWVAGALYVQGQGRPRLRTL